MLPSVITKTLAKLEAQPKNYSLGFNRLVVLPLRVRNNINLACVVNGESSDQSMKDFLNNLSESEYLTWLKFL